jgi:ferritin-like metal-binding protein YciE
MVALAALREHELSVGTGLTTLKGEPTMTTMTESIKEMFAGGTELHGLHDLFLDMLRDIYHGEKQLLKALPKMARYATSDKLRAAFETHRDQTEVHVERLEQVFEQLDTSARGKTCEAIQGLIAEAEEAMDNAEGEVLDAALVAAGQAVEHYEIARYGTLVAWAEELGFTASSKLLDKTLQEEKHADDVLNKLALAGGLNRLAAEAGGDMPAGAVAGKRAAGSRGSASHTKH